MSQTKHLTDQGDTGSRLRRAMKQQVLLREELFEHQDPRPLTSLDPGANHLLAFSAKDANSSTLVHSTGHVVNFSSQETL